jgi:DNA-binding NarL/FixJ family response regulator
MTIRVVLADDHGMFRAGLSAMLRATPDIRVIGEAGTGHEALAMVEEHAPDVVIMDLAMPELNGTEAARLICSRWPGTKILMLSMHSTAQHVHLAFAGGALGYLLKEAPGEELVRAVRVVHRGERYLSAALREALHNWPDAGRRSPIERLSPRERQILQLVTEGRTSAEIAHIVHLSPKSVETYRSRVMKKLQIDDFASLIKFAVEHGITPHE